MRGALVYEAAFCVAEHHGWVTFVLFSQIPETYCTESCFILKTFYPGETFCPYNFGTRFVGNFGQMLVAF